MPLELIIGPANAGVTRAIHARVVEHVHRGDRVLLLVPSAPDVSRATRELADSVSLGLEVRAFDRYLDGIWAAHGDGRQLVTGVQRLVVLEESGSSAALELSVQGGRSSGMMRTMARVVQRAAEVQWTSAGDASEGVGRALLVWLEEYESLLNAGGLVERGEAHRIVAGLAHPCEMPGFVAVEGFSGLTDAQERYLMRVAGHAQVSVGLTFDEAVPATGAAATAVERLGATGRVTTLPARPLGEASPEFLRIERMLGSAGTGEIEATGCVRLSEAWGEESEAAGIVREIQDALTDGIQAGEIAVVFRDARHLPALRTALEEVGLPAEYDLRVPLRASGLGRALLLLLAVCGSSGTYDQLLDLLRSRYGPGSATTMDDLDAYARRKHSCDLPTAEAWLRRHDNESAGFLAQARAARRDTGSLKSERRWFALVAAMMRRAHGSRADAEIDLMLDAAAARMFIDAVRSLNALGPDQGADSAISRALHDASIALVTTDRPDYVQVLSAERARGRPYKCVIIGGLTAAEFPRRAGDDALTASAVALEFERAGIDIASRADLAAERLIFYLAATRASERLVLSWQSHDADGDPLRRSIFIEELLDLYRDPVTGEHFATQAPHRILRLETAGLHADGPQTPKRTLRTLVSDAESCRSPQLQEARRRSRRRPDSASEAVRRVTAEREVFSASEIEVYLQCPYRWFVASVVAPRDLDDHFDAASVGLMAHEVLRRFYDAFTAETGLLRVTRDSLDLARQVHAVVAASMAGQAPGAAVSETAAARAVVRRTLDIIEADADLLPELAPAYREWAFGSEEGDEAESLGSYSLLGRIDRIDIGAQRLVVTDYKLGALSAGRGVLKFSAEGLVQLPLYAAVASRRLGLAVGGGIYRSIKGGKPRGFISDALADTQFVRSDVVTDEDISAVLDCALTRAAEAVERMRSGEIRPAPLSGSCPPYCAARAFCAERREVRG